MSREPLESWRLSRVVAGIHRRRGTRARLKALLVLCFEGVAVVWIDKRRHSGLHVGLPRLRTAALLYELANAFAGLEGVAMGPLPGGVTFDLDGGAAA